MDLYKILKALDATFQVDLERKTVNVALPLSAFTTTAAPEPSRAYPDTLDAAILSESYGKDANQALSCLVRRDNMALLKLSLVSSLAVAELQKGGWVLQRWPEYIELMGTDIRLPIKNDCVPLLPINLLRLGNMAAISNQTVAEICRFRGWKYLYNNEGVTMGKHFIPYIDGSLRLWKVLEGLLNAE